MSRWPPSPPRFPSNPASWQVTWPPWGGRSPHQDTWVFATPLQLPSPRRPGGTHRMGRLRPFLLPSTAIWNRSAKGFHPVSLQTSRLLKNRLAKREVGPDLWQIINVAVMLWRFSPPTALAVPKVARTFYLPLHLSQLVISGLLLSLFSFKLLTCSYFAQQCCRIMQPHVLTVQYYILVVVHS